MRGKYNLNNIIVKKDVYHCGTSINRIGYKTFSINLIDDKDVYIPFINKIKNIILDNRNMI